MAGQHKFVCNKGSTFNPIITLYSDEARTTPIDLSGYTARMSVRKDVNTAPIITLTTSGGITIDGPNGQVLPLIDNATTSGFATDTYKYSLELESGSGIVKRRLEGPFVVDEEITL